MFLIWFWQWNADGRQITLFLYNVDKMHEAHGSTVELQEKQSLLSSPSVSSFVEIVNCCFIVKCILNLVSHLHIFMDVLSSEKLECPNLDWIDFYFMIPQVNYLLKSSYFFWPASQQLWMKLWWASSLAQLTLLPNHCLINN